MHSVILMMKWEEGEALSGKESVETGEWRDWRSWSRETTLPMASETESLPVVLGLLCWAFSLFLHYQ